MPDDATQYVHQLKEKLQQAGANITALASRAGIPRTSLNSMMETWRISESNQESLAAVLGFDTSWPEWRDPQADQNTPDNRRRDTATNFISRLRHGPPLELDPGDPECRDWIFANFRIDSPGGQFADVRSDRFVLLDEVSSDPTDVGAGMIVGLKTFDLEFELPGRPQALLVECCDKRKRGSVVMEARGTARRPFIRYSTASPPICERLPPSEAFAHYEGAQAGDTIKVTMIAAATEGFVDSQGVAFSSVKRRRVAEHLARLQAQGEPDLKGRIVLARQTLHIKAKK